LLESKPAWSGRRLTAYLRAGYRRKFVSTDRTVLPEERQVPHNRE